MTDQPEHLSFKPEFYQQMFQFAAEGCWIIGLDLQTIEVNSALCKMLNCSRADLLGQFPRRFCNNSADCELEKSLLALTKQACVCLEVPATTVSGEEKYFRINASAVRNEQGEALFYFALVTDITQAKNTALTLEMAHLELDRIFNTAADAMCVISKNKTVLRLNEAFAKLMGITEQDGWGKKCYEVFEKDSCRHSSKCSLHRILRGEERVEQDFMLRVKDGSLRYCTLTATALKDPSGQILGIVENIRDITERKKFEETMRFQARHDILTGLPNRRLFQEILEDMIENAVIKPQILAVAFLDFDGMKRVNDQLGHDVGDELIRIVAKRMRNCIREHDHIARVGGDEFVMIFRNIISREDALIIARRILEHLQQPITLHGQKIAITASIGMSFYPEDGDDIRKLVRHADMAMYEAKDKGKGLICCSPGTCFMVQQKAENFINKEDLNPGSLE